MTAMPDSIGMAQEWKIVDGKSPHLSCTLTPRHSQVSLLLLVHSPSGTFSHSCSFLQALHGDMSQADRERKLNNFRKGKYSVLVATDVAARGLDIPNVDLVLHYELPMDTESFLHRYSPPAARSLCRSS